MDTRYVPSQVEPKWYERWERSGVFRPSERAGKPYVVVIPPPNVTGILHMGHALNNTIQDILVRWHRMKGEAALWVPGTDHAGIATQNVVERKLAREGKTRHDLGREKFLAEVWKWKEEHGSTITRQLRRLGASCDWTRERFTMDEGLSRAVREAFVRLYEQDLIYQGDYIINWCPRCQTALSDEESVHKEVEGALYYIHYPVEGSSERVTVATTRPETMLGDTAVAIHPKDERHRKLAGKTVLLPLLARKLRVIEDDFVDPEFGTGVVKVTPAHDPNDFEMGRRHKLEFVNIFTPDAHVNQNGGPYAGLDRFKARRKVLEDLAAQGLLVREVKHVHAVGHCYRCHTVVEPYLSRQWFVRMKPLAELALAAHRARRVRFVPERWAKVYANWLENIRDWCISRQIWWGHQIPVWYCRACQGKRPGDPKGGVIVSRTDPSACPACKGKLERDPDVLDTWFSSWLWPFSTLGWPDETPDLKRFYPTSDLVTAPEIIFFWVARMIMAGLVFLKDVPFTTVYIHGTVRTDSGEKMSKSKGNIIDPLDVIDQVGADALRFSMMMLASVGTDLYLSSRKFEIGRNFTNKIWNAARFVMMQLEGYKEDGADVTREAQDETDRWILKALEETCEAVTKAFESYRVSEAAGLLYHFVWHDYCDWYLELAKPRLADPQARATVQRVLVTVLRNALALLHPFLPFLTEELWSELAQKIGAAHTPLITSSWPRVRTPEAFGASRDRIGVFQEAVTGIRDLRARFKIPPKAKLRAVLKPKTPQAREILTAFRASIEHLAGLASLTLDGNFRKTPDTVGNIFPHLEVYLYVEGVVNLERERTRLRSRCDEVRRYVEGLEKRLSDRAFLARAPEDVVETERLKKSEAEKLLSDLHESLAGLS